MLPKPWRQIRAGAAGLVDPESGTQFARAEQYLAQLASGSLTVHPGFGGPQFSRRSNGKSAAVLAIGSGKQSALDIEGEAELIQKTARVWSPRKKLLKTAAKYPRSGHLPFQTPDYAARTSGFARGVNCFGNEAKAVDVQPHNCHPERKRGTPRYTEITQITCVINK